MPGYADSLNTLYGPASEYLRQGFGVFIVHPQGVGKSDGKYYGLGCKDSKALLLWLKYLSISFPENRFILHGFSFGASALLMCISSRSFYKSGLFKKVEAVIVDSPYSSLSKLFSDYYGNFTKKSRFQGLYFKGLAHCMSFLSFLSGRHFFMNNSPLMALRKGNSYIKKFKGSSVPILFAHGKKDSICRYEMSNELFEAAGGEERGNKKALYSEASHGGAFYSSPETYMKSIFCFINKG
ncbi:MAG: DUF829 domain-containing protein [Treponemataceae bacterium]|nr:DUF829 domain-containing protein [Treponemataceae bacterium]